MVSPQLAGPFGSQIAANRSLIAGWHFHGMEQTHTHGELLQMARQGDQEAWSELVEAMSPLIWSIARSFRLDNATAKDVAQTVWMRVVENLDRIEDPNRFPGWIATTCRREAMTVKNRSSRMVPSEFEFDIPDETESVEDHLVASEEHARLISALGSLRQSDQELLRLLAAEPPLSYSEIAEITGRPVGSLGPSRARALERLRAAMTVAVA